MCWCTNIRGHCLQIFWKELRILPVATLAHEQREERRLDWDATVFSDSSHDVEAGNTELSQRDLGARHGKDIVAANIRSRQMLEAGVDNKLDRDALFQIPSPVAVGRELKDFSSSRTHRAKTALLKKCDHEKIGVRDDPVQMLIQTGKVAR